MQAFDVVIMAAGKGTRMKDSLAKPLQTIAGVSMLEHILRAVKQVKPNKIIVVQNSENDFSNFDVTTVVQKEQLGSANSLQTALPEVSSDRVMVLNVDIPLVTGELLEKLASVEDQGLVAAHVDEPIGYGRVLKNDVGKVARIVEQKDIKGSDEDVDLINAGMYIFNTEDIKQRLRQVSTQNAQGEFYLTDATPDMEIVEPENADEISGVNDKVQLAEVAAKMRKKINEQHMLNGVTIVDPTTTYIDIDVEIDAGAVIFPNTVIEQKSKVGTGSHIGPNAHLREKSVVGKNVFIGNFVETKNVTIGDFTHIGHLSYVGDAKIGEAVNIGAGTIFVNYDGKNKHITTVGDRAFVGSNTKLVAPVTVARESITAAGSTITKDVPEHAMGIARSRQENKDDFWDRMEHEDFSNN